ncbi:FAD-dependent oxidoreductase [Pseudobdellovibrio exovorus]|uniref:Rieske domain-containing protein n=1 Tax=Pseudobdellovibrio exovorus JSS TaxID=1184267 RepID=M4V807_9BACT|nr:FAD-dependent oxidoreductase [Pseudobdellovibrio exovorus]AGH94570.1 hypothetical protein A11Q_350 [Pseudobdellovibrio exovorus JSS]
MESIHSNETNSLWHRQKESVYLPPLDRDINADICIIGGGIAGLTTAYLLLQEGFNVVVVEKSTFCKGQSGRSTAHLTVALDERYSDIEELHGPNTARLVAQSHLESLALIKKIITDEKIECDFHPVTGYLFAAYDEDLKILHDEYHAARRIGLDVKLMESVPVKSFRSGPALAFTEQYEMNPLLYLRGLAEAIFKKGGKIFSETEVTHVRSEEPALVFTRQGFRVTADSVVMATHSPINDLFGLHTKQAPFRTYVLGLEVPKGTVPHILAWDTSSPYHYFRISEHTPSHDMLIVGGEDHKTGQEDHPELCFARVEAWARLRFPMSKKVIHRWSGQILTSLDGLALLGRSPYEPRHIYVITGDSGNGITNCTIGAKLITDQIMQRDNPYEKIYDPSRITLRRFEEFIRTNSNAMAQYSHWFLSKPKPLLSKIPNETGVVYREGFKLVAAYKNTSGQISYMSAVCPHLGGIVQWNSVEKSWDCPCHGSRFNCYGETLEGPSTDGLKKISNPPAPEDSKDNEPSTPNPTASL